MPFYQFTVPSGATTLDHKAAIASAVTKVHAAVTGAPEKYVHCAFQEVAPGSIFVAGAEVSGGRLLGTIRSGRSAEMRRDLLHGLADAWSEISGEAKNDLAAFLHEVPGANVFEDVVVLPEAAEDHDAPS